VQVEDALVGRRDGGLTVFWCHDVTGERSDRGAGQSASARFPRPTCEAAPRRRVELCPRRGNGRGGPRAIDALQLRLRPRDGVEGRRDGAASMEAHRSARCRRAVTGLAAQGCPFATLAVKRPAAALCGYGRAREASLRPARRGFACVRL
jgi:hypothetical protein